MIDEHAPRGWVLYDGDCGVCGRWVPFWAPTLARIGLGTAPLQAPWVQARLDVEPAALLSDIRLLLADGTHLAGADVYRYVMRRLWWASPLYVLAAAPGLRRVFDGAYRIFADHRHRISAACRLDAHSPRTTPRPTSHPFLTAQWRHLVMLNYDVDPDVIAPFVPLGTTLDLWQGRALVSVVGFRFLDTRLLGAAIPRHRAFDEVNLRLYVRRQAPGGEVRHGVVFVRELVSRLAVALVARLAYNEPYRVLRMRSVAPRGASDTPGRLAYQWRIGGVWEGVAATAVGSPAVPAPGSEAAFITQHHWGYTRQRDGTTIEYEVTHEPWRVWSTVDATLTMDVARLYGSAFASALSRAPVSALVADGSSVTVSAPRRLADPRVYAIVPPAR
jgi:uncharacterized protein YqjF (DUF2071 family)